MVSKKLENKYISYDEKTKYNNISKHASKHIFLKVHWKENRNKDLSNSIFDSNPRKSIEFPTETRWIYIMSILQNKMETNVWSFKIQQQYNKCNSRLSY